MIWFAWRHVERSVPVVWGRAHTRMIETTATMESGLSRRAREASRNRVRPSKHGAAEGQPLIGPAPRSAMFFPLVVLVAVLPGLVALNSWDLTPPGPLWGLRAMAVLDGLAIDQVPAGAEIRPVGESTALRAVSFQPPLYAWLAAIGMRLSTDLDPLATVLPSYVAGAAIVVLVYLHGRLWRGGGMGLAAALLIGFNPNLLLRMQEATPTTLALAGAVGALLCYGWHVRASEESVRPWPWAGPVACAVAGGLSLGLSLLSQGGFGLIVIPIVMLHQVYLKSGIAVLAIPSIADPGRVARLAAEPGSRRRPPGPRDRPARGAAVAPPHDPDLWLGGSRPACLPALGDEWRAIPRCWPASSSWRR